jgi:hypothetical protein
VLGDENITKLRIALLAWDGPQYLIAKAIGVAPPRLTEWQMGYKEIPTKYLIPLSRILKRNPDELVGFADDTDYLIHPNEIVQGYPWA